MFKRILLAASLAASTFVSAQAADGTFVYRYKGNFDGIEVEEPTAPEGTALTLYGATFSASKSKVFAFDLTQLVKTTGIDAENVSFRLAAGSTKPDWLTLSSTGEIGGQPAGDAAEVTIAVEAAGGGRSMTKDYTIKIFDGLYAKKVESGYNTSCAITLTDGVACWGFGREGQIGSDPQVREAKVALAVQGLEGQARDVVLGMASSACAVTFDNTVKCWGKYIGSSGSTNVPTTIPNLSDVSVLTMGSAHACALKFDGSVWCWGDNSFGQLGVTGIASSATPVRASNITAHLVKINTFDRFSCGVTDEGGVVCWGYNGGGQLGNGTTTYDKVTMDVLPWPYQAHVVGLDHGVRDVSVGGAHACALLDDSTVRCWGANQVGQAGTGSTQSVGSQTPVASTAIGSGVAELKASWHNTCLRYTGGAIKCVGYGYKGALGAGTGAPWEYFGNTMPLPDITIENGFITPSVSPYTATPLPVVGLQNGAQQLSQGYFGACAIASDNLVKCWGMNYNAQRGDDTYNDAWSPVGVHDGR